jgi:hypothetical protein
MQRSARGRKGETLQGRKQPCRQQAKALRAQQGAVATGGISYVNIVAQAPPLDNRRKRGMPSAQELFASRQAPAASAGSGPGARELVSSFQQRWKNNTGHGGSFRAAGLAGTRPEVDDSDKPAANGASRRPGQSEELQQIVSRMQRSRSSGDVNGDSGKAIQAVSLQLARRGEQCRSFPSAAGCAAR